MNATVVKVAGGVRVRSRGAITWHDAKINEILGAGDEIETKDDGKIEIKIDNGNVINLKPNTKFKLQKLTQDLKTGDYENLLECNIGKIRAQVEKIKGNSKFEIKTPTAVAAVKGTVLFLNVLPNLTSAYFQGGNGTLNNIISGITQVVAAGNSSSADNQGNTSPPAPPSDAEKSQWTEGWEAEGGGEGYTPPGGGEGGEGEGGKEGGGGGGPDLGGGGGGPDIPFEPSGPSGDGGGGTTTGTPPPPSLSGDVAGTFEEDIGSSLTAILSSQTTTPLTTPWFGTETFNLSGTYSNPNGKDLWWSNVEGKGVAGGKFLGWMGGSWHSWEGIVSTIYIDPSGRAGNLFGYMSGSNDDAIGTLTGSGNLFIIPMAENIGILPADLSVPGSTVPGTGSGNLYVAFDGGYLNAQFGREMMRITGEPWGIWREKYSGGYDRPDDLTIDPNDGLAHWIGVAGGNYNEGGYFFSAFEGMDNLRDSLRMDVLGAYLDYTKLGSYYGTTLGTYIQSKSYYFEGVGLGAFVEESSLTSSGRLFNSIYHYGEPSGYFKGLIGTLGELWNDEPFDLVSIGEFENYGDEPFTWFSGGDTLYSEDPVNGTYTTYDYGDGVGAFYGITGGIGGIGGKKVLEGMTKALYIDPNGNAGILSGNLNGVYSNYVGYLLEGELTKNQIASAQDVGVSPEDLYDSVLGGGGRGQMAGSFTTSGGEITGWDNLTTMSIVNYENGISQNWGIYGQTFNGEFDDRNSDTAWSGMMGGSDSFGAYYYRWGENPGEGYFNSDSGYWIADITNGVWDDITAELHGRFLTYTRIGEINGEILGTYNDDDGSGDWQAIGLGTWEGEPLDFAGYVYGGLLYYDQINNNMPYDGYPYGLLGGFGNLWAAPSDFVFMGDYYTYGYAQEPYVWYGSGWYIYSYNAYNGTPTTFDGGAFYGFAGGLWDDGIMTGGARILYIQPGEGPEPTTWRAGYLKTTEDISGNYYPGIGMWEASGEFTPVFMGTTSYAPENLVWGGAIDWDWFDGLGTGTIGTNGTIQARYVNGTSLNIYDQNWGIWNAGFGGTYVAATNSPFSLLVGGTDFNEYSYWLSNIEGTWEDNEIRGKVTGNYLSYENFGTIEGELFGAPKEDGTWLATAVGSFGSGSEVPLAWSADLYTDYHYGYDDEDGVYIDYTWWNDDHYGIIGATESPFPLEGTKTVDINLMGETYPDGYITWWGSLSGSYADESEIPDGFIAGRTNSIEGMLVSLYVDTLGNAGTLEGTFEEGNYYPEIDMWQAEGSMTATKRASGYNVADWGSTNNYIDGYLYGDFDVVDGGEIYNDYSISDISWGYLGSYTTWLVKEGIPERWGIYNIELGGYYDDSTSDNWTLNLGGDNWRDMDDEYWLATITGSQWSEQRIAGELTGQYLTYTTLGTIEGNVLGSYDTDSDYTWEAIALGTFTEEPLTFSGYWGNDSLYNNRDNGNFEWVGEDYGLIGSTMLNWWQAESFLILAMGDYYVDYDGEEPYIWNTPINSYNANEYNSTTLDGGAFYGFTAGIWDNQVMDGAVAALYIDPSGNAGVLRGDVDGEYYPDLGYDDYYDHGMWQAEGALTPTEMAQNIGISPEELGWYFYNYSNEIANCGLYGDLGEDFSFGESDIYGWQDSGYTYRIGEDANWGIFNIKLGDENYYNGSPTTWSAAMGGDYWRGSGDTEYWLATIEEGTWANDEIRGEVNGHYISDTYLGTIEGDFFGVNNGYDGTWIGTTVGVWYEEPLTFSGYWEGDSLYYNKNNEGYPEPAGEEYGLIGSATPNWWNEDSFPVVAMGEYGYRKFISEEQPKFWNTYVYSDYITQDGAAFAGVTAGIWNNEIMDGAIAALYMDPSGNAGVLRGDVSGNYYPSLEMWMAEGTLTPTQMAQAADLGISPQDFVDLYISDGYLDADVYGGFASDVDEGLIEGEIEGEDNYIEGETDWGNTYFIDDGTAQPWGIYDLKLQGPDSYSNPADSTVWGAEIYGDGEFGPDEGEWIGITGGSWLNGEIRGALAGLYVTDEYMIGLIRGNVFGLYDEEIYDEEHDTWVGTWIGESIGVFNEMGAIDPLSEPIYSEFFGTGLGSFESGGTLEVVSVEGMALGIFNIISEQDWGIWAAYLEGTHTEPNSPFRLAMGGTHDGFEGTDGYWLGTLNGDWENGILDGDFKGVWFGLEEFDQSGDLITFNVGSVTGDVNGTYVDTTWEAVGVGEWVELAELNPDILGFDNVALAEMVDMPITETYASLLQGTGGFGADGTIGNITGAMDISFYAAAAQDLSGIWAALINGNYSGYPVGSSTDNWTLTLNDGAAGTSATLSGTQWSDGQWLASVNGTAPDVTFTGQAGGTYTGTNSGTFTGVGAGTWEDTTPPVP